MHRAAAVFVSDTLRDRLGLFHLQHSAMPLKRYGVLKGWAIGRRLGTGQSPHFQIHIIDELDDYRIAINVMSKLEPSQLEYLIVPQFQHPFLEEIEQLDFGWNDIDRKPGGPAMDFIRSNLFDPRSLQPLPFHQPGPDNDLNEKLDYYIQRALADEYAVIYAFGERWGPEWGKKDRLFGFSPGNGVHDIHMNQGNAPPFRGDDGVYQDGCLLIHFQKTGQWVGIFLKFQSQAWHTDDRSGHRISAPAPLPQPPGPAPTPDPSPGPGPDGDGALRIIAALANPVSSPEVETVTLLNVSGQPIPLEGWVLLDRNKNAMPLQGVIGEGDTLRITLKRPVRLANKGGMITILNPDGLRVDGVTYTRAQASKPGVSIKF